MALAEQRVEIIFAVKSDGDTAQREEGNLPRLLEALVGGKRHPRLGGHLGLGKLALLTAHPYSSGYISRNIIGSLLI